MNIGIDIDDVTAEFMSEFLKHFNKKYGTDHVKEELKQFNCLEQLNITRDEFDQIWFNMMINHEFYYLKPVVGARVAIDKISEENQIIFLTNRMMACDTVKWLELNQIQYDYVFCVKNKNYVIKYVPLDVYIDDRPKYIKEVSEGGVKCIVFDQPWNRDIQETHMIKRAHNWTQIKKLIEEWVKNGR